MDIITIGQMLLRIYLELMKQSGKTREERDQLYADTVTEFESRPHPSTLEDTVE